MTNRHHPVGTEHAHLLCHTMLMTRQVDAGNRPFDRDFPPLLVRVQTASLCNECSLFQGTVSARGEASPRSRPSLRDLEATWSTWAVNSDRHHMFQQRHLIR